MSDIEIQTTSDNTLLFLDSLQVGIFNYVKLTGSIDPNNISSINNSEIINTAAIRIKSVGATDAHICTNITFDKCVTQGTTYGIDINSPCKGLRFENGSIRAHFKGVVIGDKLNPVIIGDPIPNPNDITGINITRTIFDIISSTAIFIENSKSNSSAFNLFYDVGNSLAGIGNPTAPVIDINHNGSVSIGDLFERPDSDDEIFPRITLNGKPSIAFDSTNAMFLGSYSREVGLETGLVRNTSAAEIFKLQTVDPITFKVDYTISRGNNIRMGNIVATSNFANAINPIAFNDEYSDSIDTLGNNVGATITITNDLSSSSTSLNMSLDNTDVDAIFNYSITRLD